jgi:sugar (pentulose or hexulose) kinase
MVDAGPLFLGFDVGTQGVKALVVDAERHEVVVRACEPLELNAGLPPGWRKRPS